MALVSLSLHGRVPSILGTQEMEPTGSSLGPRQVAASINCTFGDGHGPALFPCTGGSWSRAQLSYLHADFPTGQAWGRTVPSDISSWPSKCISLLEKGSRCHHVLVLTVKRLRDSCIRQVPIRV